MLSHAGAPILYLTLPKHSLVQTLKTDDRGWPHLEASTDVTRKAHRTCSVRDRPLPNLPRACANFSEDTWAGLFLPFMKSGVHATWAPGHFARA
jgi:hypothetical protein